MSNQDPKKVDPESGESFFQFLMNNKWDAFAYLVLFVGLILSIFERLIGGLIVGVILGLYFSQATKTALHGFKEYLTNEGIFRGFILVIGVIALFIASPGLCIGTLFGAFIRPYLGNGK
jgi:hypothetical protein